MALNRRNKNLLLLVFVVLMRFAPSADFSAQEPTSDEHFSYIISSPDNRRVALMVYRFPENSPRSEIAIVDAATMEVTRVHRTEHDINGPPLWRRDSKALLWAEYVVGDSGEYTAQIDGRVVEWNIETGELTIRTTEYPWVSDVIGVCSDCLARLVWWTEDGFAGFGGALFTYHLFPYDAAGTPLPPIELTNMSTAKDGSPNQAVAVETEEGLLMAIHYYQYDQWDLVNPLTGEFTALPPGTVIRAIPRWPGHAVILPRAGRERDEASEQLGTAEQDCSLFTDAKIGDQVQAGSLPVPYYLFERPLRVNGGTLDPLAVYTVERTFCPEGHFPFLGIRGDGDLVWVEAWKVGKVEAAP